MLLGLFGKKTQRRTKRTPAQYSIRSQIREAGQRAKANARAYQAQLREDARAAKALLREAQSIKRTRRRNYQAAEKASSQLSGIGKTPTKTGSKKRS